MYHLEFNFSPRICVKPLSFDHPSIFDQITAHNLRYKKLCSRFLPVVDNDSIWRYSRRFQYSCLEQGWKLHVSATILTANEVFEKVAPLLENSKVHFKAPATLSDLKILNAGTIHGYSQVGKFIVVYPQSDTQAVCLAEQLHQLTNHFSAPAVPFDLRYKPGSSVYYRYGSFKKQKNDNEDGSPTYMIRDPSGQQVPDLREAKAGSKPDWVTNPFPNHAAPDSFPTPLDHTIKVFRALSQRGKGGVFEALDFSVADSPRLCIVKEGRRHGETDWDGRDGFSRVRHEEKMLKVLMSAGVEAPRIYTSFETENSYYLILESIQGESLQDLLRKKKRRLSISRVVRCGFEIAKTIAQIHAAGLVWRDLKPANLFMTKRGRFRPLDFEGACLIKQPDLLPWGTRSFMPPESSEHSGEHSKQPADLFALGVVLYFLIEGKEPEISNDKKDFKLKRRNVPPEVSEIIGQLLDSRPEERPDAKTVNQKLQSALR